LGVTVKEVHNNGQSLLRVTLRNPTQRLAFQAHVSVRGARSGAESLPVLWSDNYVSLLPASPRLSLLDIWVKAHSLARAPARSRLTAGTSYQ